MAHLAAWGALVGECLLLSKILVLPPSLSVQSGKTRKKERVSRGEDSVKVAVRVRPFSQRELESNAKLCVQMDGNITTMLGE